MTCSPDAAFLASRGHQAVEARRATAPAAPVRPDGETAEFRAFIVGWQRLKGILGECSLPIVWPEFVRPDIDAPRTRPAPFAHDPTSPVVNAYQNGEALSAGAFLTVYDQWRNDVIQARIDHVAPEIAAG